MTASDGAVAVSATRHALASNVAACIATFCFNPLEIVRTRMMSQDGTKARTHGGVRYVSTAHALRHMRATEGARVFFRGAHVAAVASGFSHGVYMLSYRQLLARCSRDDAGQPQQSAPPAFSTTFACSVAANVIVAYVTNPIWLVKTRIQLGDSSDRQASRVVRSAVNCVVSSARNDGPLVFWRGCTAQVLLAAPSSLHLPLYEAMLRLSGAQVRRFASPAAERQQQSQMHIVPAVLGSNIAAKTLVTVLCHPFTLLRTRLQDVKARSGAAEVQYRTLRDAATAVWRSDGTLIVGGFTRGLAPSLLQVVPRSALHILLYELIVHAY